MRYLFLMLLIPSFSFAESKVIAFKDEAYVVDLKLDEDGKLARAEVKESKGTLPSVMELKILRKSQAPLKLNLKLVPDSPHAYEGKLHAPYGSYAAAAFEIRFNIGGSKKVLRPSK